MTACGSDDDNGGGGGSTGGKSGTGGGSNDDGGSTGGSSSGGGSGDGGSSGGGTGGSAGGGTGGAPPNPDGCPTHPNVEELSDGTCSVTSSLTDPITEDLTMDAGNTWFMAGPVIIGDDAAETILEVEAGTTVFGGGDSFVLIQRHSKIMAEGTASAPIVFTSAQDVGSRAIQDWGGLIINGLAPINNAGGGSCDANAAPGEAATGCYGGTDAADDSGVLKYVRVEFAGKDVDATNELNGIAFQGVGTGTTVDFIQVHMTQDDAVEFFGGTVNVKHLYLTGKNDDGFDWTGGWSGKAQFVYVHELAESGDLKSDPRGIEADNLEQDHSATPFSTPTLSNFTLVSRSDNTAQPGIMLRRGTKGQLWNFVVSGYGPCVRVSDDQTIANVTDGSLAVKHMVLDCPDGNTPAGDAAEALLGATDADVVTGDPMIDADTGVPATGSPALGMGEKPADAFFDDVDYAGAFDEGDDWADGWIETATN
jgi:hypothetical protein